MKKIKIKFAQQGKFVSGTKHQNENNLPLAEYYFSSGYEFHMKGQTDKAINNYEKALQFNPNMVGAYYNLGTIFQSKKLFDEAVLCYHSCI